MKNYRKIIGRLLLLAIFFFASAWVFNHLNAWLGVSMYIMTFYFLGESIVKFVKKYVYDILS